MRTCDYIARTAAFLVMHVFIALWIPAAVLATSFEQFDKMDLPANSGLIDSLTTKLRSEVEKQYPERKEEIEGYFSEDPFWDVEFEIDLDEEINAYRQWAEDTGADLADYTIEDVATKVVARRFPPQLTGSSDGMFVGIEQNDYDQSRLIIKDNKGQLEVFIIPHPYESLKVYMERAATLKDRRVRVFWQYDIVSESSGLVKTVVRMEELQADVPADLVE